MADLATPASVSPPRSSPPGATAAPPSGVAGPRASGLDDVVAAWTAVSHPEGGRGQLLVAGLPVDDLAGQRPFEAVCASLWQLGGGDRGADEVAARIAAGRVRAFARLGAVERARAAPTPMSGLAAALAPLEEEGSLLDAAADLVGACAVYAAAYARSLVGQPALAPDPEASHAADLLRMSTGRTPSTQEARALDAYLVAVIDHGLNASTFTARVVASTGADAVAAVVAALGALSGPLHGGAPGPVLDMLDAVGGRGDVEGWLRDELAAGRRIMGMGHRVYRTRDPRAFVLERALTWLEEDEATAARLALAREVERTAERLLRERYPERALRANVEFFTAVLLAALGVDRRMFTAFFACARVAGWMAHVDEQRRVGRLIRPASVYVGSRP